VSDPDNPQIVGMSLNFNYDLSKVLESGETAEAHKLVIEVLNLDTKKSTLSTEFELDLEPGTASTLKEGTGFAKKLIFKDDNISSKITTYNKYLLKIYDQVGDQKVVLASKELKWFVTE